MIFRHLFSLFFSLVILVILSACSKSENPLNYSLARPAPYCSQKFTYSDFVTISGNAGYEYLAGGNGEVSGPNPIRHAEVRVTNTDKEIIQCATTDEQGNFSVNLPKDGSTVLVTVASRADNSFLKLYVLKDPKTNVFHSLEQSVVTDSSQNIGSLVAHATGSLEGGAFNILDKILDTNSFLRDKTKDCGENFPGCKPFDVAPLTTAYWSKGVNPNKYLGSSQKSLGLYSRESFYSHENNQIYILGGENGDVDRSDTDHFDDTIIIHEYGHVIEHFYSNLRSPKGPHDGNDIIDPRLAFAEAWANFLQAQVTGKPCYRDTYGPESPQNIYEKDLEEGDFNCEQQQGQPLPKYDLPTVEGEGNFREFAITRALIDIFDENNEGEGIDQLTATFAEFWTLFTSKTVGIADKNFHFSSVGRFLQLQIQLKTEFPETKWTDWSEILEAENLRSDLKDFGDSLVYGETCHPITIQAKNIPDNKSPLHHENGTFMNSNLFDSNDFYEYNHTEDGPFELNVHYISSSQGEPRPPLDIFLYGDNYTFGKETDMVTSKRGGSDNGEKSLSVASLKKGVYMINIMVYTGDPLRAFKPVDYNMNIKNMNIKGQRACPSALSL